MSALSLMQRFKPWLAELPEYVPGKPPSGALDGKLSSNELPLAPPAELLEAITQAASNLNRYPDPLAGGVTVRLAERLNLPEQCLLVGNGSDELISLLTTACLGPGARVALADPPYPVHRIAALIAGAEPIPVPLTDYRHDLTAMAAASANVVLVTNPHNPTGTTVDCGAIEALLERSSAELVVVDEAYIGFADDPGALTALPLIDSGRVVVLRTFSKLHGLAGARIGYLAGSEAAVAMLRALREPFSVNALAQAAAIASLDQPTLVEQARALVQQSRERMRRAFQHAGFQVAPTQANFLCVRAHDERALLARLAGIGISARPGSVLGMPGHIRISVGARPCLNNWSRS